MLFPLLCSILWLLKRMVLRNDMIQLYFLSVNLVQTGNIELHQILFIWTKSPKSFRNYWDIRKCCVSLASRCKHMPQLSNLDHSIYGILDSLPVYWCLHLWEYQAILVLYALLCCSITNGPYLMLEELVPWPNPIVCTLLCNDNKICLN